MVYRPIRYEQIMKIAEDYDVRARRMFNGMGIYTGERMFAFLYDEEIGLKLSPEHQQEALAMPGAEPLRPDPQGEPMKEYVKMPHEVLDNYEVLAQWIERSTTYVQRKIAR